MLGVTQARNGVAVVGGIGASVPRLLEVGGELGFGELAERDGFPGLDDVSPRGERAGRRGGAPRAARRDARR